MDPNVKFQLIKGAKFIEYSFPSGFAVGHSRDKDGCTPNVRVPMVLIGRKYRDSWG